MTHLPAIFRALPLTLLAVATPSPAQQQPEQPLDTDITEQVEVRLVLIDALVVDRKGRIVPDLTLEDFELQVGYRPHSIDTLDVFCPSGAAEDPRPVARADRRADPVAPGVERKIVLALDYMHLEQTQRPDALKNLRATVGHTGTDDDEIMVAAITGTLRIEQGFTRDHQAVVETLHRMENDITLWQPPFDHEHELRFFNALTDLVEVLELIPGSKAVVLVSNITGSAQGYDPQFRRIASRAAQARVALYPVLQIGMASFSFAPKLARLAVESGGRFTGGTNDMSLAYARAQRDLACRYTVGFYDPLPDRDRHHRLTLRVIRPGLRVIHPENYGFRSPKAERKSRVRSAHYVPDLFEGGLQARFIPLRPRGPRKWEGVVAVRFPLMLAAHEEAVRELGVRARRGNTTWHRSLRTFSLRHTYGAAPWQGGVTVLQPVQLKPGRYDASAVLGQPGVTSPWATGLSFELSRVPRHELIVVGPILGDSATDHLELEQGGAPGVLVEDFRPRFTRRVDPSRALSLLNRVCFVGPAAGPPAATVRRRLDRADGTTVNNFGPSELDLEAKHGARCDIFLDRFDTRALRPGDYVYRLRVEPAGDEPPIERSVEFTVERRPSG